MSDHRVELHPTYILHTKPYRDTSLLIETFTHDYGRVGMVARGVRGVRASKRSPLQPFRPYLFSWHGRGDLATLSQWEAQGPSHPLAGGLLMSGFYLNELLLRLTHRHDPHPELFQHYFDTLNCLTTACDPEGCLRGFERQLLEELGYGLILDHEAETGEELQAEQGYCYYLERGPVRDTGTCSGIRLHGQTLLELSSGSLTTARSLKQAKLLMRAVLSRYLGDKPLQTRELFRQTQLPTRAAGPKAHDEP